MKTVIPVQLKEGIQEIFHHRDDNGVYRHFPIETMRDLGKQYGGTCNEISCTMMRLIPQTADYIRKQGGIEQDRLDRLEMPYIFEPIIVIKWSDEEGGGVTIIDGNHRYIKLFDLGVKGIKAYVFMREFWESLLVKVNVGDEESLTRRSGLIEKEIKEGQANGS